MDTSNDPRNDDERKPFADYLQCPECGGTKCVMEVSPEDGGEQVRCTECGKIGR